VINNKMIIDSLCTYCQVHFTSENALFSQNLSVRLSVAYLTFTQYWNVS